MNMFSAGDSSGEGVNSLNQFGNMRGSVDWAALAQQWIQMRDNNNSGVMSIPDAPPPPNISGRYHDMPMMNSAAAVMVPLKKTTYEEKGEADMDMDEDDEHVTRSDSPPPPAPSMQLGKSRAEVMQSQQTAAQAPWFVQPPGALPAAEVPAAIGVPVLELGNGNNHPTATPAQWNPNAWPPRIILPPPTPIMPVPVVAPGANPTAHIPSLMKINVPNPNTVKTEEPSTAGSITMDAAKRKILPAWIREGLEKMEREKQKQLERQQAQLPTDTKDIVAAKDEASFQSNEHTVKSNNAKFLESDSSGNEEDDDAPVAAIGVGRGGDIKALADLFTKSKATATAPALVKVRKTHSEERDSETTEPEAEAEVDVEAERRAYVGKRSYEERLAELMVVVRRTITELLLEVTTEEISKIAQEAVNSRKAKASSAQVIRKSALSSITGKLGLAAYDDSSGEEDSSSENEASADNDNEDSEEEIKASIRTKRRAFAKISEEIEERIAVSATREEQKLKYYTQIEQQQLHEQDAKKVHTEEHAHSTQNSTATATVSKGYERDFGETTDSKLQHSNGKRQKERSSRKERTTRFSDNKDSKSASMAAAASYISQMQSGNNATVATTHSATLFPIATSTIVSTLTPTTTMPDSNHLYTMTAAPLSNSSVAINKNLLNAAEAAFEKATKSKSLSSEKRSERDHHRKHERERERERRHGSHRSHRHHSSDDSSSSDSNSSSSSSSSSSHHSKYSHASSSKHKRDNRSGSSRKHSRSRSRDRERDRGRHHRRHRHHSSGDEYDDYEHRTSRHRATRHSTKRRSRSKSRSSYSSSSRRHRH